MSPRTILITGANRGIGLAILQALALRSPSDTYLLGCRDVSKGQAAIESLRKAGVKTSTIEPILLNVASDDSVRAAVTTVSTKYGALDVLINNAGIGILTSAPDFSDYRAVFAAVYETNVTSVALCMQLFLPLLRTSSSSSSSGLIVNVSSARASAGLTASGAMAPTVSVAYSSSKAALNLLTVALSKDPANEGVQFQLVSPGHCKTEFNGYRGSRDPLEGANVVVGLVNAEKGAYPNGGFWETKGSSVDVVAVPW